MGDVSGETPTVPETGFLRSRVRWEELVNQRGVTAAATPGASRGEDGAIRNVLICSPVQTLMTLRASKEEQTTGCNERENKYPAVTFFFITV